MSFRRSFLLRWLLCAAVLGFGAAGAGAQQLHIALSTPITSLDPHFHNLTPNNGMAGTCSSR